MLSLALKLDTTHIYQTHIDGSTPTIGGVSYVVATPQQVATAVHQFLHPQQAPSTSPAASTPGTTSTTPQLPVAKVNVTVLNGSGQAGVAAVATSQLQARGYRAHVGGNASSFTFTQTTIVADAASQAVARRLAVLLAPARVQASSASGAGAITVTLGSSFAGHLAQSSTSSPTQGTGVLAGATPYDLAQWQALAHKTSLPLFAPSRWSASLGYDQFRAYSVRTPSGMAKAAVVVGPCPGPLLGRPGTGLDQPAHPRQSQRHGPIAGRTYSLYYDGGQLHMVAWKMGHVAYWVSNTLDDELSNPLMLALATSFVRVG